MADHENEKEVFERLRQELEEILDGKRADNKEWTASEKKILREMISTVVFFRKMGRFGFYLLVTLGVIATNLQSIKGFFSW